MRADILLQDLSEQIAARDPRSWEYYFLDALRLYQRDDFTTAMEVFLEALRRNPVAVWDIIVREFSFQFSRTVEMSGREEEIVALFDAALSAHPHFTYIRFGENFTTDDTVGHRDVNMGNDLPSVVFVPQVKSASVSTGAIFTRGFRLTPITYSMIDQRVIPSWLRDYMKGGACYVTHLKPRPENIRAFAENGAPRIIVNIRDPRQAFLSDLHYRREHQELLPSVDMKAEGLDDTFVRMFAESFVDRVDWIKGWIDAEQTLDIRFMTFEAFVADRDAYLEEILSYYDGPRDQFKYDEAFTEDPDVDYHRRLGETREWERVFTPEQIDRLHTHLDDGLLRRFGWS